jgi:translation elongation factor EF-Tu-like GTPase
MSYTWADNRGPDVEAEITFLRTEEGGRSAPSFSGYRPNHKVRDDYLTSGIHNYIGCDKVDPGQTALGTITFITPEVYPHCLTIGQTINVQEGGRLIGRARITKILNKVLESRDPLA